MFTPAVVHAFNAGEPVVVPAGQSFYTKEGMAIASKDENGRKRSKTDLRYRKTKTVGSGYFYI
jgi:hypothetical protein